MKGVRGNHSHFLFHFSVAQGWSSPSSFFTTTSTVGTDTYSSRFKCKRRLKIKLNHFFSVTIEDYCRNDWNIQTVSSLPHAKCTWPNSKEQTVNVQIKNERRLVCHQILWRSSVRYPCLTVVRIVGWVFLHYFGTLLFSLLCLHFVDKSDVAIVHCEISRANK